MGEEFVQPGASAALALPSLHNRRPPLSLCQASFSSHRHLERDRVHPAEGVGVALGLQPRQRLVDLEADGARLAGLFL